MARVLIAGCGYVGSALGGRLVAKGNQVWGLRRRPLALPQGIQPIEADLSVARSLEELPPRIDHVVYAVSPAGSDDAFYRAAYVEGIARLIEALDRQGQRPRRVFFLSSTGVYAQSKGEWVDESSPTEPTHFSGKRLLEGEKLLADSGFAGTVLRLGGIYGPRRTRLLERVRSGQATYRKGGPFYSNRIHRDDCAGALQHLMELEAPGSLYIGVDEEPAEEVAVLRWIAGALGAPEPRLESEPSRGAGDRPRTNKRCRGDLLRESGYAFAYPTFREGYTAVISELGLV
jgi:nucleoside-diphosphate-sugar epimerase